MEAAGELLRRARKQAGLSEAELAQRAGVTQSVVSAYESGARQPSLPTLARLVEATGLALEVGVSPGPAARRRARPLARSLNDHRSQVLGILGRYGLANPRLFGSVASGREKPGSDIDILVDVPPGTGLLSLARCQAELEALLGAPVDLVPASYLKPGLADDVAAGAVALRPDVTANAWTTSWPPSMPSRSTWDVATSMTGSCSMPCERGSSKSARP